MSTPTPQQLIDALTANGWTIAGQRTGVYTRLNWPGETGYHGRSIVIDGTSDGTGYVLAVLTDAADIGRRSSAVLASIANCTCPPARYDASGGVEPLPQGTDPNCPHCHGGKAKSGTDEDAYHGEIAPDRIVRGPVDVPTQAPGAALGPTHRAQSGERLAVDIVRDLRALAFLVYGQTGQPADPVLDEAASRMEVLLEALSAAKSDLLDRLTPTESRILSQRLNAAQEELVAANARAAKVSEQLAALEERHAKLGEARDRHSDRADEAERQVVLMRRERDAARGALDGLMRELREGAAVPLSRLGERPSTLADVIANTDPGDYWPVADAVHAGWRPAGGLPAPVDLLRDSLLVDGDRSASGASRHGYTSHGHPCCDHADPAQRPALSARCRRIPGCRDCTTAAATIPATGP